MELPIYRSVVRQFGQRVDLVRDHQWDLSTPDRRWTVGQLVDEMTALQQAVAAALTATGDGATVPPASPGSGEPPAGRVAAADGSDGAAADRAIRWSGAASAAVAAFGGVQDWTRTVAGPCGVVTAEELLWRTATELSIHTWDLARAIGAPDELPNDLLAHVLDRAREHGDRWFDADRYAPPIPVPGCTEDLIELLALAGRNRWWRRSA